MESGRQETEEHSRVSDLIKTEVRSDVSDQCSSIKPIKLIELNPPVLYL